LVFFISVCLSPGLIWMAFIFVLLFLSFEIYFCLSYGFICCLSFGF
jgi:hypothetical protein